jgi:hypothetical protein
MPLPEVQWASGAYPNDARIQGEVFDWAVDLVDKFLDGAAAALAAQAGAGPAGAELTSPAGTQKQHHSVGDFLRAYGPFEGKNDLFDSVSSSEERYGVQLNIETVPV